MKKIRAFTLSEVLIVLTIIGVIASVTVPALVRHITLEQRRAQLKKTYANLTEITNKILAENGGTMVGLLEIGWTDNSLISKYLPYMNVARACHHSDYRGNCWHLNNGALYDNGTPASDDTWEYVGRSVTLADGSFFAICDLWPDCNSDPWGDDDDVCAYLKVDLNGFKGPNIYGKDIFEFAVAKDRIIPSGTAPFCHDPCADGTHNCYSLDMLLD